LPIAEDFPCLLQRNSGCAEASFRPLEFIPAGPDGEAVDAMVSTPIVLQLSISIDALTSGFGRDETVDGWDERDA
jgi:hypothetical protein